MLKISLVALLVSIWNSTLVLAEETKGVAFVFLSGDAIALFSAPPENFDEIRTLLTGVEKGCVPHSLAKELLSTTHSRSESKKIEFQMEENRSVPFLGERSTKFALDNWHGPVEICWSEFSSDILVKAGFAKSKAFKESEWPFFLRKINSNGPGYSLKAYSTKNHLVCSVSNAMISNSVIFRQTADEKIEASTMLLVVASNAEALLPPDAPLNRVIVLPLSE